MSRKRANPQDWDSHELASFGLSSDVIQAPVLHHEVVAGGPYEKTYHAAFPYHSLRCLQ